MKCKKCKYELASTGFCRVCDNPMKNTTSLLKMINTRREKFKNGDITAWNKGLTKYNDKRLYKLSENMKINNPMKNMKIAKKQGLKQKEMYKNGYINPCKNKKFPKISIFMKINNPMYNKETREKHKKITSSKKWCKYFRIKRIKEILKDGGKMQLGKHEKQILDELELGNNIIIIRQYEIIGYILDGYCSKLNIAFEIDENWHFINNKLKEKDIIRQKNIKKELKCKFIRIKDNFKCEKNKIRPTLKN